MDSSMGRMHSLPQHSLPQLSCERPPESGGHGPDKRNAPQVTAVCADTSLLQAPSAATATLENAAELVPVIYRLGQLLTPCDLLNLRHSLAPKGWARAEISHQAAMQCQTEEQVLLIQAIHCLSCPLAKEDQDLRADLHDLQSMQAFFQREIAPRYDGWGLPLPDPAKDKPLVFVLKCQVLDERASQQATDSAPCTATLLRQAVETGSVPVAFKILKGLQLAKKYQLFVPASLKGEDGKTLLQEVMLYKKPSPLWLKLVLAAAVFDLHPDKGSAPLNQAIYYRLSCEAVALLLKAGADPNRGDDLCPRPIATCFLPSVKNSLAKVQQLLNHGDLHPDAASFAVHKAVEANESDAVKRLLAYPGTNPDFRYAASMGSPLALAVILCLQNPHQSPDMVQLLASKGGHLVSLCLTMDSAGNVKPDSVNCLYNLDFWLEQGAIPWYVQGPSQERKAQLKAAIDAGRQEAEAAVRQPGH